MDEDIMINIFHIRNADLEENIYSMGFKLHIDHYTFDLNEWDAEYPCVDLHIYKQCLKEIKLLKKLRIS